MLNKSKELNNMKVKLIEIKESIWELPDNFYDDKDYDEEDLSDCEIASDFKTGKKLWEQSDIDGISWKTTVYNHKTKSYEEVSDDN